MRYRSLMLGTCIGVLAALAAGSAYADADLDKAAAEPKQLGDARLNDAATAYSTLKQINAGNVGKLQVAWTFSTGVLRGHEGAPLVIGNMMYVHTPFPNIGLRARSRPRRQDRLEIRAEAGSERHPGDVLRYRQSRPLLSATARSSCIRPTPRWSRSTPRPARSCGRSRTAIRPRAKPARRRRSSIKDKVLVGTSGGEFGVQCHVTAYDIKDGKQVWRGYSEGPDDQILVDPTRPPRSASRSARTSSLKTWQGDQWKIGGGCTWGWMAYDPQLNLVYYGSGNPSTWNPSQRPGDNKWSMTIWARNLDTGVAKWVYQMTPHDEWDYDGVNEMILTDQRIDGRDAQAPDAFRSQRPRLHARSRERRTAGRPEVRPEGQLDHRRRHEQELAELWPADGRRANIRPRHGGRDHNTKDICPAALGTKDEQPAAYSPETQLFYVPTNHVCMDYEPFKVSYTAGQPYVGATLSMYPPKGESNMGNFIAWDGKTGKIVWSDPEQFSVWSGALATAGGVVFYGTLEGYLKAVDAKTGKELYKFKTPSGIIGNVMTYEHGGKQYIAVLSGVGGWAGIGLAAGLTDPHAGLGAVGGYAALSNYTALGGQLTVFAVP